MNLIQVLQLKIHQHSDPHNIKSDSIRKNYMKLEKKERLLIDRAFNKLTGQPLGKLVKMTDSINRQLKPENENSLLPSISPSSQAINILRLVEQESILIKDQCGNQVGIITIGNTANQEVGVSLLLASEYKFSLFSASDVCEVV